LQYGARTIDTHEPICRAWREQDMWNDDAQPESRTAGCHPEISLRGEVDRGGNGAQRKLYFAMTSPKHSEPSLPRIEGRTAAASYVDHI
jgi:hypothetical protein